MKNKGETGILKSTLNYYIPKKKSNSMGNKKIQVEPKTFF